MQAGYYWASFRAESIEGVFIVYWTGEYIWCLGSETARELNEFVFGPRVKGQDADSEEMGGERPTSENA